MMQTPMHDDLAAYIAEKLCEFEQIPADRRNKLEGMAWYVRERQAAGEVASLNFVCTHNSRRSHIAQLWAAAGAARFGVHARTYSGGTEATAFNPRAVAAIARAGFLVERTSDGSNPVYHVRVHGSATPMACFSKKYDDAPNPKTSFAAVMVCTDADESCPTVHGADARFAIPFVDPKVSDGTPQETATYDERCAQIAREMLYVFSRVGG